MIRMGDLLLLSSLVGGCAFTNVTVPPPTPASLASTAEGAAVFGRHRMVMLGEIADARPVRQRCGMKKNGFNMDTGSVYCAYEPAPFLADMLAAKLVAAGFQLVDAERAPPGTPMIQGTLRQFFIEPKVGFFTITTEADIELKLHVTTATGLEAERTFYVKGDEVSAAGWDGDLEKAINDASRKVLGAAVGAFGNLMDRFAPESGPSRPVAVLEGWQDKGRAGR